MYIYGNIFSEFILAREIFQTEVVQKIKTFYFQLPPPPPPPTKVVPFMTQCEKKYGATRLATDENTAHALRMLDN